MTETSERNGAGLIAASPASMAVLAIALLSGIGIVLLSASQAFAVLAGGLVLAIVLASPYAGLCLFCALAVVVPYTTVTLGRRIAVPELILAMTWLSVLWRVAAGSLSLRFGKTERAVLVLMAFSVIPLVAGEHALPDPGGRGPVLWARWLLDLSAVLLVPAIITERTQATRLLTILIGSAAVMVAISTAMFALTHRPDGILPFLDLANYGDLDKIASFYTGFPGRMGSPWLHPNALGGLLALLLPLAINRAMTARAGKHAAFVLIVLLLGLGLVLGGSRGATVSVALTVIWLVHARFRRGLVVALALAAVAVVVIGVRLPLFERLSEISPSDPSIAQRLDEYRAFPGYVASYPLGIGFVETVSFEADQPVETTSPPIGTSNLWLVYALQLGLAGLAIFLWITYRWWREVGAGGPALGLSADDLGVKASVYAAFLTGFFDHYFGFTVVLTAMFWLMIGLSLYLARASAGATALPKSGTNLSPALRASRSLP